MVVGRWGAARPRTGAGPPRTPPPIARTPPATGNPSRTTWGRAGRAGGPRPNHSKKVLFTTFKRFGHLQLRDRTQMLDPLFSTSSSPPQKSLQGVSQDSRARASDPTASGRFREMLDPHFSTSSSAPQKSLQGVSQGSSVRASDPTASGRFRENGVSDSEIRWRWQLRTTFFFKKNKPLKIFRISF